MIPPGGYLLVADRQGDDEEPTTLTGVENVHVHTLRLPNDGIQLTLEDREGELIDRTPEDEDAWPAGHNGADFLMSMERRGDLDPEGEPSYEDGVDPAEWYTWNEADGTDTTHPDSRARGTPGADNTDPLLTLPPAPLPFATSLEPDEPQFRLVESAGTQRNDPPPGIDVRTGERVLSTTSLTQSFGGRPLQSADCIELDNATDPVIVSAFARASEENSEGDDQATLRLRLGIEWYTDELCRNAHPVTPSVTGTDSATSVILSETDYEAISLTEPVPTEEVAATHLRVRVEVRRQDRGLEEFWAADDLLVEQQPEDGGD